MTYLLVKCDKPTCGFIGKTTEFTYSPIDENKHWCSACILDYRITEKKNSLAVKHEDRRRFEEAYREQHAQMAEEINARERDLEETKQNLLETQLRLRVFTKENPHAWTIENG